MSEPVPTEGLERHGYSKGPQLGEGAFGTVYKGREVGKEGGREVALKKMRLSPHSRDYGIDVSTLREVRILRELRSEVGSKHIVQVPLPVPIPPLTPQLLNVFVDRKAHTENMWLVYELMATDLERVIKAESVPLTEGDIKAPSPPPSPLTC